MCLIGTLRNVNVGKLENLLILIIIQCPISGHWLRRTVFFHSTWAHHLSDSPTLWCKWVFIFAFCNLIFLTYCVLTVCVFVCVCSWFFTFVVVSVPAWTLNYMITQWILHFVPKSVLSFQQQVFKSTVSPVLLGLPVLETKTLHTSHWSGRSQPNLTDPGIIFLSSVER